MRLPRCGKKSCRKKNSDSTIIVRQTEPASFPPAGAELAEQTFHFAHSEIRLGIIKRHRAVQTALRGLARDAFPEVAEKIGGVP